MVDGQWMGENHGLSTIDYGLWTMAFSHRPLFRYIVHMESIAYPLTGAGFLGLTVIMLILMYRALTAALKLTSWSEDRRRSMARRFAVGTGLWLVFLLGVSATGFFEDFSTFPPRLMIALAIPLVTILIVVFSAPVKELLPLIPQRTLVGLQGFRIFVELLIWAAFVQDQLPIQMTFEGRNLDVLSGILGIAVALTLAHNRTVLYLYNFIALGLLVNIVTIAILSMPVPFRVFMNEPANVLVTRFPFVVLPAMLVPFAYGLSFLSLRQLSLAGKKPG